MKEIRQKSADPAVNKLLVKAYRQKESLVWDRLDAMQPQCGFGRIALCCDECFEGPCRVNPFDETDQQTLCGRDRKDLSAGALLRRVQNGAAAIMQLASSRNAELNKGMPPVACFTADVMSSCADLAPTLADAGQKMLSILSALSRSADALIGSQVQCETSANMGVLRKDAPNIVFIGHVHPEFVKRIRAAAENSGVEMTLSGICGNEGRGSQSLPILTNYASQELPLLTDAIDLLIVGNQCVMPSTLRLAGRLGIPVVQAATGRDDATATLAVEEAVAHFRKRAISRDADIPSVQEETILGVHADDALFSCIADAHAQQKLKGVVFIGGCGTVQATQDAMLVRLAEQLLADGHLILTSGCAGAALAKSGLCAKGHENPLKALLPDNVPGVLHFGACHEMQGVIDFLGRLHDIPSVAVMPELAHAKPLATATALAASGVPVILAETIMPGLNAEDTGNLFAPLGDFTQLPQLFQKVCQR